MDNLNPSEISEIIKGRIDSLETSTTESNEGTIVFLSDGIARVHGLSDAMYGELIEFEGGVSGMALNLERDSVGVVIFGDYKQLAEGGVAKCTGKILEVPVGPELVKIAHHLVFIKGTRAMDTKDGLVEVHKSRKGCVLVSIKIFRGIKAYLL